MKLRQLCIESGEPISINDYYISFGDPVLSWPFNTYPRNEKTAIKSPVIVITVIARPGSVGDATSLLRSFGRHLSDMIHRNIVNGASDDDTISSRMHTVQFIAADRSLNIKLDPDDPVSIATVRGLLKYYLLDSKSDN